MRILHTVEFYQPSTGGAQEVIRQLSERLAALGHDVTVATSFHRHRTFSELNGVAIQSFKVRGNMVKGIEGESKHYRDFVADSGFDVVMNYAAQTWTTDLTFSLLNRLKGKKVIAPLGYSRLHDKRYKEYFLSLPAHLKHYDTIVYTSSNYQDKLFGDRNGLASKATVIPNGAALEEFARPQLDFRNKYGIREKYMFLTVSNHYFEKRHSAVINAFREAAIPDAALVVIGDCPSSHSWYSCHPVCRVRGTLDSSIKILTGVPRPWVVSAFQEADLFLFASKVECAPLVMYESFASRTPFITTPVGNVTDHKNLVNIVTSREEMASMIRAYVADPRPSRERAQSAYSTFEAGLSWDRIAARFASLYES